MQDNNDSSNNHAGIAGHWPTTNYDLPVAALQWEWADAIYQLHVDRNAATGGHRADDTGLPWVVPKHVARHEP